MSSMDTQSPRRTRLRGKQNLPQDAELVPDTVVTPNKSAVMANAMTPRRSTRKSCKPIMDYLEIINLGSPSKKKDADEDHWNPAVVGRTSEKRGRKRTHGTKLKKEEASTDEENDMANISMSIFSPNRKTEKVVETKKIVETRNEDKIVFVATVDNEENINEKMEEVTKDCIEATKDDQKLNKLEEVVAMEDVTMAGIEATNDDQKLNKVEEVVAMVENEKMEDVTMEGIEATTDDQKLNEVEEVVAMEDVTMEGIEATKDDQKLNEVEEVFTMEDVTEEGIKTPTDDKKLDEVEEHVVVAMAENEKIQGVTKKDTKTPKHAQKLENNKMSIVDTSELDFLELGLTPLQDDPENEPEHVNEKEKAADVEVESLMLSDVEEMSASPNALNATFDTSDCIIISPTTEKPDNRKNTLIVPQIFVTSPPPQKTPRIQTPYKPKKHEDKKEKEEKSSHEENVEVILDKTFDEIIPLGIRKRSASISTDTRTLTTAQKRTNRVTFYSPANQTNYINDSEEEEMQDDNMKENIEKIEEPSFITKRRRRSMSFDETIMRKPAIKKPITPMKATGSRIKLPNFAAIHKKNFEQMENIVEHVARKAERAKVLTSATKKPQGSTGKTQTPGRFGRLSTFEKEKTKATRKIDLGNISKIPIIIPTPATTITPQTRFKKAASAEPQTFKNLHKIKSKAIGKKPLGKNILSKSAVDITVAAMKAMENTSTFTFKSALHRGGETSSSAADKIAERRQRNMNMFKNRIEEENNIKIQKKRDEIRGVRLNRRHLLQMEHRRNMSKLN